MAVFLRNDCSFVGCYRTFNTLSNLIQHIEENHIASDPKELEKQETQQPSSLNLSYILKVFTEDSPKENLDLYIRPESDLPRSVTPLISSETEQDEEEISVYSDDCNDEDENSDDSTMEAEQDYSYDFILGKVRSLEKKDTDQPLKCPIAGCTKQYKNINGMKYHAKTAHKAEISRMQNIYKCTACTKIYKTPHGLRNHHRTQHNIHVEVLSHSSTKATKKKKVLVPNKSSDSDTEDSLLTSNDSSCDQNVLKKVPGCENTTISLMIPTLSRPNKIVKVGSTLSGMVTIKGSEQNRNIFSAILPASAACITEQDLILYDDVCVD